MFEYGRLKHPISQRVIMCVNVPISIHVHSSDYYVIVWQGCSVVLADLYDDIYLSSAFSVRIGKADVDAP